MESSFSWTSHASSEALNLESHSVVSSDLFESMLLARFSSEYLDVDGEIKRKGVNKGSNSGGGQK